MTSTASATPAGDLHAPVQSAAGSPGATQKLSLGALAAMVVGSMVGAGVFSLPANFGEATGVLGAVIGWAIAGTGMLMLAFVFQTLAMRRPDLDAGVYAYAKAGFGDYLGFISAFGYWASACVGNVSYWVLIKSTLGKAVPILGEGNTLPAVAISSVGIWAFHFMILRGIKEAAGINTIVTAAKVIPILLFIGVVAFAFQADVFSANFWGADERSAGATLSQVRGVMLATVFVFLGVEGASVYSRYAKRREDVGKATVLGFLGVLALFAAVTILSYAVLPRLDLAELRQPSMSGVMQSVVGNWGAVFIGAGLIVSVLGAYLAWSLMAAEVAYVAARHRDMPRALARLNDKGVPATALWVSNGLVQAFLLITLVSEDAFSLTLELTSALSLVPYLLAAAFATKLSLARDLPRASDRSHKKELLVAASATVYTVFLLYAAGLKYVLLSCLLYGPGTVMYVLSRREQRRQVFTVWERTLFLLIAVGAVFAVVALAAGRITI